MVELGSWAAGESCSLTTLVVTVNQWLLGSFNPLKSMVGQKSYSTFFEPTQPGRHVRWTTGGPMNWLRGLPDVLTHETVNPEQTQND